MAADFQQAPVYVPRLDTWPYKLIRRGSAIVGSPRAEVEQDGVTRTLVYYEGNVYAASNMHTLADRAMFAYWRLRDSYPTIAQAFVELKDLIRVGDLYPELGTIGVKNRDAEKVLADWLDAPSLEPAELLVQGVRV